MGGNFFYDTGFFSDIFNYSLDGARSKWGDDIVFLMVIDEKMGIDIFSFFEI